MKKEKKKEEGGKNIWELSIDAVTNKGNTGETGKGPEEKNKQDEKERTIKIERRDQPKKFDFRPVETTPECKTITATHDNIKDWINDETGYYLIRIKDGMIEAGLCKETGKVSILVKGTTAEDIYNTIIREDIVGTKQHAAYLGMELMKAEACLKLRKNYVQDAPFKM